MVWYVDVILTSVSAVLDALWIARRSNMRVERAREDFLKRTVEPSEAMSGDSYGGREREFAEDRRVDSFSDEESALDFSLYTNGGTLNIVPVEPEREHTRLMNGEKRLEAPVESYFDGIRRLSDRRYYIQCLGIIYRADSNGQFSVSHLDSIRDLMDDDE